MIEAWLVWFFGPHLGPLVGIGGAAVVLVGLLMAFLIFIDEITL